jgi:hypothetical protein
LLGDERVSKSVLIYLRMSSKLPYKGDVNEAQRNGDRAAIRTIMAWRKRRELGQLDLEESVDDASPTTTAASSQSSSVDEGSVAPPLEATRGPSGPAEQNTTVDTERAPTGTNSTAATPKVSPAQASAVGPNDGMNSDSDDGPPPLESCSDSSSEEGDSGSPPPLSASHVSQRAVSSITPFSSICPYECPALSSCASVLLNLTCAFFSG